MGISADKARDLIAAQKAMLLVQNADAISDTEKALRKVNRQMEEQKLRIDLMNKATNFGTQISGDQEEWQRIYDKRIRDYQKIGQERLGLESLLKTLKGDPLISIEDGSTEAAVTSLVSVQEKLLEQARKMPATTEAEIILRNRKIETIETEIKRLENLGKTQTKTSKEQSDARAKLLKFLEESDEKMRFEIERYFNKAGEGAMDAFFNAIDKKRNEWKTIFDNFKLKPEEEADVNVDYILQQYADTEQGKLNALQARLSAGKISELEYQEEITRITREAEDKRLSIKKENIEKAQQMANLAANFVYALMDYELEKAGENEEQKKEIRKKYADIQFIISAAQIVTDTAVSIMKSFSQLGPIAGAIFAGIIGATGALQLGIANAQRQQIKGLKTGGYTGSGNENEPAGVVHRGEWVAPAWMVRQPDTSRIIDTLELMRTNRSTLNTSAFKDFPAMGYRGSNFVTGQAQPNETKVVINSDPEVAAMLNQVKNALDQNTKATKEFMNWKPKVAAETIEKELNTLQYIRKHSRL